MGKLEKEYFFTRPNIWRFFVGKGLEEGILIFGWKGWYWQKDGKGQSARRAKTVLKDVDPEIILIKF